MLAAVLAAACANASAESALRIGSKRFTESYVLGEVLVSAARRADPAVKVEHRAGLGNTGIVLGALRAGSIDVYPEYSGTLAREVLKLDGDAPLAELNRLLAPEGLAAGVLLGFHNGYALALRPGVAGDPKALSELAKLPALRLGLSQEFMARADGWPLLVRAYGLPQRPSGLDHGLAYEAIAAGRTDAIDVYTTDAKIARYGLVVMADDRKAFPRYDALLLYRADLPTRLPAAWRGLAALEGRIDEAAMRRMNAAVELEGRSFAQAAATMDGVPLEATQPLASPPPARSFLQVLFGPDFAALLLQHLLLVGASLAAGIAAGVPLGVLAARSPAWGRWIIGAAGVIQTVPSLALLALLIAVMGAIGTAPALVALSLYALLPIVRNTQAGLEGVGEGLRQAARALGLTDRDRLLRIELPLAAPVLLAGIKTAAVINVGTATIAAFVGAGGLGERIVQGLALNDRALLLAGAIPAALLALLLQGGFELWERRLLRWRRR